ncbi:MAG: LysO family transporter [Prolixibacteraceae bacterium]|nr:LysO family transporter [Prolixibacteraceae bacterium]
MTTVLILMAAGILLGVFLNKHTHLLKVVDRLITYAIYLLLFLLGIAVGTNKTIIANLGSIGIKALLVTLGSVAGSVLVLWMLYNVIFPPAKTKERKNEK